MVIYLYGADTFRSRQYLKEQVAKFKIARDPQGYNVVFLDATKESAGKITGELLASPFLAARRLIVVENLLNHSDSEFLTSFTKRVEEKRWPDSNVIMVWQGQAPGKSKIVKTLHELLIKQPHAEEFVPLAGAQLSAWITNYLKSRSRTLAPGALDYLIRHADKDSWLLQSTLDQLIAYTGDLATPITPAAAALFLEEKKEDNIFNLVDAILSGNHAQSRKLLQAAREAGVEDGYLFNMLARQVRVLLLIRSYYDQAANFVSDAAAQELGLHPFVVKKSLSLIKRSPLNALKNLQAALLTIDGKIKNGLASQAVLIDLFVAKT